MSIWSMVGDFFTRGGWRTWGPNSPAGLGAFAESSDDIPPASAFDAMCLSAVWACMVLRAEVIGTLPIQVRDKNKKVLDDHPLTDLLRRSPNSLQTGSEFWSMQTGLVDFHGNGLSRIMRRRDKSIISLEPMGHVPGAELKKRESGGWFYDIGGERFGTDDILHLKGFTLDGMWGASRLQVGSRILAAQIAGNTAAIDGFRKSLKVGGFFEVADNLTDPQLLQFKNRLDEYAKPENRAKWMTLLKGMKPVSASQFALKASENELLASRGFGIEEICRLFGVPPQLIYHTDKASSWASSIENINLFFLMYSLQPTFIRYEQRIEKSLLSVEDRTRGINVKFNINGLVRADAKTRTAMYASALQNGWLNVNEVRDLEDRLAIEGGEEYRVQMNMAQSTPTPKVEAE